MRVSLPTYRARTGDKIFCLGPIPRERPFLRREQADRQTERQRDESDDWAATAVP